MTKSQQMKLHKLSQAALKAGKAFRDSPYKIGTKQHDDLANAWIEACKKAEAYSASLN